MSFNSFCGRFFNNGAPRVSFNSFLINNEAHQKGETSDVSHHTFQQLFNNGAGLFKPKLLASQTTSQGRHRYAVYQSRTENWTYVFMTVRTSAADTKTNREKYISAHTTELDLLQTFGWMPSFAAATHLFHAEFRTKICSVLAFITGIAPLYCSQERRLTYSHTARDERQTHVGRKRRFRPALFSAQRDRYHNPLREAGKPYVK